MKKILLAFVIILAMVTALACGSGGGGGGATQGYLGGIWSGTWTSQVGPWTGTMYITLSQDGLTVTGSGYITDDGERYDGTCTGTVTNADGPGNITLGMAYSGRTQISTFTGSYTATTITGTYADSQGDRGTFVLVKQ